jgi:pimeloyl-ACP methyl ester carboxylesterase
LTEIDLVLPEGRSLHAYDTGPDAAELVVFWHHGTPNVGRPPEPLFPASERLGIRWISYDRPGYGPSTPRPGRDVASAAGDASAVADALGVNRFAVIGHSGGAPHALACAALLPDRVLAAVVGAGLAPYEAEGLDWFDGMAPGAETSLRAALQGREAKERYEASAGEGDIGFIPADFTALQGEWSWFGPIVNAAMANGPGGLVDDDLAYVAPWGFDLADVRAPALVIHGGSDRAVPASHGRWVAERLPNAELWLRPEDGHISVLRSAPAALEWVRARLQGG